MKIIFIPLIIIIVALIFLAHIGLFVEIVVEEKEMGPYVLVYEDHKGDYKGTANIQDNIYYSLLRSHNIKTYKGFGIYYDNPKEVATSELRSIAGVILEEKDYDKKKFLTDEGYSIKEVEARKSIVVEFPYKNNFSVMLGLMRVYPVIEEYIKSNDLENKEMMEIYDVPSGKIIYLMEI